MGVGVGVGVLDTLTGHEGAGVSAAAGLAAPYEASSAGVIWTCSVAAY